MKKLLVAFVLQLDWLMKLRKERGLLEAVRLAAPVHYVVARKILISH